MSEPLGARAASLDVVIDRFGGAPGERGALDAIAAASFDEQAFDLGEETARPFARVWVARTRAAAGAPAREVGFALVWLVADEVQVLTVATSPDVRRKGVGRALVSRVVGEARAARARLVLLEVKSSNVAAIRLYRALGFSAMGVRRGYYSRGNEDAYEMMLRLDETTGEIVPTDDQVPIEEA